MGGSGEKFEGEGSGKQYIFFPLFKRKTCKEQILCKCSLGFSNMGGQYGPESAVLISSQAKYRLSLSLKII